MKKRRKILSWQVIVAALGTAILLVAALSAINYLRPDRLITPKRVIKCPKNLEQIGLVIRKYEIENQGQLPVGETSGEIFIKMEDEGYLERNILICPDNPIDDIDLNDPEGVGYYIDPDMPAERHPMRAIAADRAPWQVNHDGEGVHVAFDDDGRVHVRFVTPEDSGPQDKISNPYIKEDTDIYADTGDPYKHAWIRWERERDAGE